MTFASDHLYKGYLRRNMPTIVSRVNPTEIIPHLPCLTDHDRVGVIGKTHHNVFCTCVIIIENNSIQL